ncbi:MAG: bacillithiol system redox-active protein YtxJ [Lutibacter sp.]
MDWRIIDSLEKVSELKQLSFETPVLIFKHSTRCGISRFVLKDFEVEYNIPEGELVPFYLDLIDFREISNKISTLFQIGHESPQILLIKDGKCIYDASHGDIAISEIKKALN